MEFSAILAAAYEDLGYPASPPTDVSTRLKRYANEGLQAILAEPALKGLIEADTAYTFASVANQARYVVPEGYAYPRTLSDLTNDRPLGALSLSAYRGLAPVPANHTGVPTHYVPLGRVACAAQPSDASSVFIDSDSASDTGTCYIEGIITGGYRRTASVSMTGTTAVNVSSAIATWIEITDVYLSTAAVGTVTLHEDASGGTELARIAIGQKRPNYHAFALWPTPAGAYSYRMDVRRELETLVQDTDEPPLPRDVHPMLVAYVAYRDWQRKDDTRAMVAKAQYDQWLSRLKYRLSQTLDAMPVARTRRVSGLSRLGPQYPADTWVVR